MLIWFWYLQRIGCCCFFCPRTSSSSSSSSSSGRRHLARRVARCPGPDPRGQEVRRWRARGRGGCPRRGGCPCRVEPVFFPASFLLEAKPITKKIGFKNQTRKSTHRCPAGRLCPNRFDEMYCVVKPPARVTSGSVSGTVVWAFLGRGWR